ncbi:MAG TPA: Rrf2 family transcriptional regulator [Alkalispirochaeta sp.]|nr:Rrf2 family transcriptional regulator [Alkalispirochaeta sp.]
MMFSLSSKAIYGVTALVELSHHYRSGPVQIRDIATRHEIPQHYLEQILSALKRTGIVRSYRGARGGYELTRHPDTISLLDVLTELEGPLGIATNQQGREPLAVLWDGLQDHIREFLTQSLGDLIRLQAAATTDADFMI